MQPQFVRVFGATERLMIVMAAMFTLFLSGMTLFAYLLYSSGSAGGDQVAYLFMTILFAAATVAGIGGTYVAAG